LEFFNLTKAVTNRIDELKAMGHTIGVVPTMGALHAGHLSLVEEALKHTEFVVVSIFVNPTQFDNVSDLAKYPRTLDTDIEYLRGLEQSKLIVFAPTAEDIYGGSISADNFDFSGLEHQMEGAFRKGHFDGVATIVKRLFDIVKPDVAFFGEKDFQQLQIIRKLVERHNLPVKIIGCPISRHDDGLAMSSRNQRLSEQQRAIAPFIHKILLKARDKFGTDSAKQITAWVKKEFEEQSLLELEYFTIADSETLMPVKRKSSKKAYRAFIAVYAGDVRLIDNIALN
jgi:pantoate--beta-alanine ligase